jgi:superfamily II DNA or RNA helicase
MFSEAEDALKNLDNGLRSWQSIALETWESSHCRGMVEVVTGGGKTRFALAAASRWLRANSDNPAVVVIVPTMALQDQWYVNLTSDLGVVPEDICIWPERKDPSRRFHVMVVNTARTRIHEIAAIHRDFLLIADECHRYASEENSRALRVRTTASLGLTATADREFDDGLERILIPNLGPIIYRYTLAEARRDEVVSDFSLANVRVPFTEDERVRYDKASKMLGIALSQGDEERAKQIAMRRSSIAKNAISRVTATVALLEKLRNRKVIVFHEDIAMADLIASILKDRGHRVVTFHSKIGKDMRRDNLRMFKSGQSDVLVCCRALDEGIDVPEAECAILAASTSSHRQRVQRLGRVLRTHQDKDLALIYTIYVSDQEQERLVAETGNLAEVASIKWLEMSQ